MTSKPLTDDGLLSRHTGALPVGRVRPVTLEEEERRETMFRADAVLALTGPVPTDIGAFEQHVASLIDGVRPVARIKSKSGVSSADLRIALASLCDRRLLRLAGIVVEAPPVKMQDTVVKRDKDGNTLPGVVPDLIPPHVMADIVAMMEEDDD